MAEVVEQALSARQRLILFLLDFIPRRGVQRAGPDHWAVPRLTPDGQRAGYRVVTTAELIQEATGLPHATGAVGDLDAGRPATDADGDAGSDDGEEEDDEEDAAPAGPDDPDPDSDPDMPELA